MDLGPEQTLFTLGTDWDKGMNRGMFWKLTKTKSHLSQWNASFQVIDSYIKCDELVWLKLDIYTC